MIKILLLISAFSQIFAYPWEKFKSKGLEKVELDLRLKNVKSAIYELLVLLKSTNQIYENEGFLKQLEDFSHNIHTSMKKQLEDKKYSDSLIEKLIEQFESQWN